MSIRKALLRKLDRVADDSCTLEQLGQVMERVPAAVTKMAFIRHLVRAAIRIVGHTLALPRIKIWAVTATVLHMLPDDDAVERFGQDLACLWAAILDAQGMTRTAHRVRVVNGLIAV